MEREIRPFSFFKQYYIANASKGKETFNEEGGVNFETAGELGRGGNGQPSVTEGEMGNREFNMMMQMVGGKLNHAADSLEADLAATPILDMLDIAGYNYASGRYPMEGKAHPGRVIFGSETLPQDIAENWKMVKKCLYLIGDFMWTAVDYLGETGSGAWSYTDDARGMDNPYPWISNGAGVIDLIGNPDGEALYTKTIWSDEKKFFWL